MKKNSQTVLCPKCRAEQAKLRMPKGIREALWGGWTCNNCGCKMDKQGNYIM